GGAGWSPDSDLKGFDGFDGGSGGAGG
ncbi:hypothetical protein LDE39_13595, partial [Mycobacterium tuberculosis]